MSTAAAAGDMAHFLTFIYLMFVQVRLALFLFTTLLNRYLALMDLM